MCCTKFSCLLPGRGPKILAHDDLVFLLGVAFFVDKEQALLLSERRIGQHHCVITAPWRSEPVMAVANHHLVAADAVQIDVHCAHAADLGGQFHSFDQLLP
jgi:hypothetical protein